MSDQLLLISQHDYAFTWVRPSSDPLKVVHTLSFFTYLTSSNDGQILSIGDTCEARLHCANGHELSKVAGMPIVYVYVYNNVTCDVCKKDKIHLDNHLHHCSQCGYAFPLTHSLTHSLLDILLA